MSVSLGKSSFVFSPLNVYSNFFSVNFAKEGSDSG